MMPLVALTNGILFYVSDRVYLSEELQFKEFIRQRDHFVVLKYGNNIMTIEDFQTICKKLKGVTQDIKWETHLCFNVVAKMFLITSPDSVPHSASFKVTDEDFAELTSKEGFIPAPYLSRYKWVYVDDINRLTKKQWEQYAVKSYQLIASKLPVKPRKTIGIK